MANDNNNFDLFDKGVTPSCPHEPPNVLMSKWLRFTKEVFSEYTKLRSKNLAHGHRLAPVVKLGLSAMSNSGYVACQSDKDQCMILCDRGSIDAFVSTEMDRVDAYCSFRISVDYVAWVINEFKSICLDLATAAVGEDLAKDLLASFLRNLRNWGISGFVNRIGFTVKSHKCSGDVKPRVLHLSHHSPFKPPLKYLSRCINSNLKSYTHIVADSSDLLRKLHSQRLVLSPNARFVCIDIKDFFMSGTHSELAQHAPKHVPQRLEVHAKRLISLVLRHQVVQPAKYEDDDDETFYVARGSGMGMTGSGEILDCAVLEMAELPLLPSAQVHGVVAYYRFKDDIIAIVDGADKALWKGWLCKFMRALGSFKTLCTKISRQVDFLDLKLSISDVGTIPNQIFVKPTSLKVPLGHGSCHPASIHIAWPLMQLSRFKRLSNAYSSFASAAVDFCNQLRVHSPGHPAIAIIQQAISGMWPETRKATFKPSSRLTLPFNPNIVKLSRVARGHGVSISWRLGGTHLFRALMRCGWSRKPRTVAVALSLSEEYS